MKAELRLSPHMVRDVGLVCEIWYNGHFIGQIVGADGPGVRIISKYAVSARVTPKSDVTNSSVSSRPEPLATIEIQIGY